MWSLNNERSLVVGQGGVQSHKKKQKPALDLMKPKSEIFVIYCQYLISLAWEYDTLPDNYNSLINKRNSQTWLCICLYIQSFLHSVTHSWHRKVYDMCYEQCGQCLDAQQQQKHGQHFHLVSGLRMNGVIPQLTHLLSWHIH